MKKILIYSVNPGSPHLAVDLELAHKFLGQGDRVIMVRCTGQLRSCLVNPNHSQWICRACKSKYEKALDLLKLSDLEIYTIPLNGQNPDVTGHEFESIEELKAYKFEGVSIGMAVASTLIGRFHKDHKFNPKKYLKEVQREIQMSVDVYLGLKKILDDVRPDEVYLFNGRFSTHHPLIHLCENNGITYYTHERGGVMNKYILRKNALPHNIYLALAEMQELWNKDDPQKEHIGSKFFEDRRGNIVQSWISFTETQNKGLLPKGFDRSKVNIAIFNSTLEEYEGMDDWKNPIYIDDNDGIRRLLESFKNMPDYVFYLRVHPNLKLLRNSQMLEIFELESEYPNLALIRPEESVDSYSLMENADKVLTFCSTMGVEATYWNKVSILLGKSLYMDMDICFQPTSHEEAVLLIKDKDLAPKDRASTLKYGYWEISRGTKFELFDQQDLHTISYRGEVIEADKALVAMEKIAKLTLLRNRRDLDNLKDKIKNLVGLG